MSFNNINNEEIKKFIDLLMLISKNEKLLDNNRCLLAQDLFFDAASLYNYILFKYSDKKNNFENKITLNTFSLFVSNELDITINDEILSKFFDFYTIRNNNEIISLRYIEFADIFYPRYNLKLRKFLQQRNGLNKDMKSLNNITKMLLQKLFIKQINMIKYIFHCNDKIIMNYNDIFKIISDNKSFITKHDLINTFDIYYKNLNFTDEDINSIIISLSFNNKHYFSNKNINAEGIYFKSFENIFTIKKKIFSMKSLTYDDKICAFKSIILNTIYQEKKIEEAKISIIKRKDFNFIDLFNIFVDDNDLEKSKTIEFENFLEKLNININEIERELLLRRIDLLRKRYINKSDLFDFFVPFNKEFREEKNIKINKERENKEIKFSKGTLILINHLINVIIKGEKDLNLKKMKLDGENEFIEKVFNDICNIKIKNINDGKDNNINKGYFGKEELYKFLLERLNLDISENDMILFFIRLDKLRREKIEILEFSDEMKCIIIDKIKLL